MRCATRFTVAPGQRVADEGELARAGLGEAVRHRQDGAVVLGDAPAAVGQALGFGQVAVLVEDGGQGGDLLVEGEVGGAREGAGDPAPTPLLEELVDRARVGSAQVPEQLGREVAVALGVERLGRRRQLVDVSGPAPARPSGDLVAVDEQAVLLESRQLQTDGGRGQRELVGHGDRVERALALEQVEDGPPRRRQLLDG